MSDVPPSGTEQSGTVPDDEIPDSEIPDDEIPDDEIPDDEIPDEVPGSADVVTTNGVRLHVVAAGPEDGKLLVLLHGFPEFWYGWHETVRPLANAGFRVVVPDQRGYNRSEKPAGVAPYRIGELARDVVGLVDAYGRDRAAVAGHDWGGVVAWWVALHHPDRISELVAVNAPHPTVFERTLRSSWDQRRRSWYTLAFQLPRLPEWIARARDWRLMVRGLCSSSQPGTFSEEDLARYRRAWSREGAVTAMINWYRAAARERPTPERTTVDLPTLVVWGTGDELLRTSMAYDSVERCENGRLLTLRDATHWVIHEEPIRVAEAIADHADDLPPGVRE